MKSKTKPKNKIKELREERGISSRDLAKKIGTSAPHMSRLENGQTPLSIKWIAKIANVLDVNSNDIVDLPLDRKFASTCDDTLLGCVLGWLLEAADKQKLKLSRKDLSKWTSFIYKEAVEKPLSFKETEYMVSVVVKILRKEKG